MKGRELVPEREWLEETFGILWSGEYTVLGQKLAGVFRIQDEQNMRELVVRMSVPDRIDEERLEQVHRFLFHCADQGVKTPVPLRASNGHTIVRHEHSGRLVEVFPFVKGRRPEVGDIQDGRRIAAGLASFHKAGVSYRDLPGEESCDQNHVALERLQKDVQRAKRAAAGQPYESLFIEAIAEMDTLIASLNRLRGGLVDTGLHLDVSPGNTILSEDGAVWFIDCSHAARGRRVYDVHAACYCLDRSCAASVGDSRRYEPIDQKLTEAFLESYQAACQPPWMCEETEAYRLERRLALVHGAAYWVLEEAAEDAEKELFGYRRLRARLG